MNTDAGRNKLTVSHISGNIYSDIVVSCLLDYGEPSGQQAFDNFRIVHILGTWYLSDFWNTTAKTSDFARVLNLFSFTIQIYFIWNQFVIQLLFQSNIIGFNPNRTTKQ